MDFDLMFTSFPKLLLASIIPGLIVCNADLNISEV